MSFQSLPPAQTIVPSGENEVQQILSERSHSRTRPPVWTCQTMTVRYESKHEGARVTLCVGERHKAAPRGQLTRLPARDGEHLAVEREVERGDAVELDLHDTLRRRRERHVCVQPERVVLELVEPRRARAAHVPHDHLRAAARGDQVGVRRVRDARHRRAVEERAPLRQPLAAQPERARHARGVVVHHRRREEAARLGHARAPLVVLPIEDLRARRTAAARSKNKAEGCSTRWHPEWRTRPPLGVCNREDRGGGGRGRAARARALHVTHGASAPPTARSRLNPQPRSPPEMSMHHLEVAVRTAERDPARVFGVEHAAEPRRVLGARAR